MNMDSQSRKQPTEEHFFIQSKYYKELSIFLFLFSGYFVIFKIVTMFGSTERSQNLGMSCIYKTVRKAVS